MNPKILSLGQTCLRIVESENDCASFLGGSPLVRSSFQWPVKNGNPLVFVGQLDLGEMNREQVIPWLPTSGRLLFFYDFEEFPWGIAPEDEGGWAVLYENGSADFFSPAIPPEVYEEQVDSPIKYLSAEKFISYPDLDRLDEEEFDLSEEDEDAYCEFLEELYGEDPRHQLGGYPTPVQSDFMEDECQLSSAGVYCESEEDYDSPQVQQLLAQENDWRLLLQLDSDDDIDLMWGDMGMLYFWIRESDARKCDFSKAWMILQCG